MPIRQTAKSTKFSRYAKLYLPAVGLLFLIGFLFEIAPSIFAVPRYLISPPSAVYSFIAQNPTLLYSNLLITATEILEGFAIGAVVGFLISLSMVYSPIIRNALYPLLSGLNVIPKVALAPVLLIWLGLGTFPITVLTASFVLFPVVLSTTNGLYSVDPEILDLAKSLKATTPQVFAKIRIPAAMPQIFTGLELGTNLAVIGAVVGEFVAGSRGIGYILVNAAGLNYTTEMYAALALVVIMGIGFFAITSVIERFVVRWYYLERAQR